MESINEREEITSWLKATLLQPLINEFSLKSSTYKNHSSKEFIKTFTIDKKFDISYISSKIQNGGGLCGYHCLFNLLYYLRYRVNNYNTYYLAKMNSNVKFWKTYKELIKELCIVYPEDVDHITSDGSLDRNHLNYLLGGGEKFLPLLTNEAFEIKIYSFFLAFGCFSGMSKSDIVGLQNGLEYMRTYKKEKPLLSIINLGTSNHWSCLIIENRLGKITFTYLDSHNEHIFNLKDWSDSDYDMCPEFTDKCAINHAKQKEYIDYTERACLDIAKYRKPLDDWLKKCYIQWVHDINFAVRLFYKILYESFSLYEFYFDNYFRRLTWIFKRDVCWSEDKVATSYDKLIKFLKEDYHPKVLYDDVYMAIKAFGYVEGVKKINIFTEFYKLLILSSMFEHGVSKVKNPDDVRLLNRYFRFIEEVAKILDLKLN
jgi:hypothetical protein